MDKESFEKAKKLEMRMNNLLNLKVYLTEMNRARCLTLYHTMSFFGTMQAGSFDKNTSKAESDLMAHINQDDLGIIFASIDERVEELGQEIEKL